MKPTYQPVQRLALAIRKHFSTGALGLCLAVSSQYLAAAPGQAAREPMLQARHSFDISVQELASALISFGQQSGLQVTMDPALLGQRYSQSVVGEMSAEQALQRLLRGSGIGWRFEQGTLVFSLEPSARFDAPMELNSTVVLGTPQDNAFQGETVINRKAIKAFPGANGDITTLLRMHPSVQFNNAQQSSNAPGEIDPADISINGAKYYQNNFMIDGISINNDLDPGEHSYGSIRQFDSPPSRSHGIALDADLLEEVRVYDSNVPAEYGGFNGGVIDAITRKPSRQLHGKLSASMTRSQWTRYHINEADRENFAYSTDEQYQPDFEKTTVRGTLEGHLTDDFGAIVNFSQKRSTIGLNANDNGYSSSTAMANQDQTRRIDNYLIKTYWNVSDRLSLDTSLTYAPQENYYFFANRINGGFVNESGGWQGSLKSVWSDDTFTWTNKLALTNVTSSRDSDSDYYINWYYSDVKNWGNPDSNTARSAEGNYGDVDQTQRGATWTSKVDWQPLEFAGLEHHLTVGIDLSHQTATWERLNDAMSVGTLIRDNGTRCDNNDSLCSIGRLINGNTRQYATRRVDYSAGKIEISETKYALFMQDTFSIGDLTLRPGVRLEGDDYMEKKTIAPRFSGDYDIFGDRSSVLVFGANRYYGRNLYKYRLADGRGALQTSWARNSQTGTWTGTRSQNLSKFSTLDIPYDDELTLGLEQRWLNSQFSLKYVYREGNDKINRAYGRVLGVPAEPGYDTNYFSYTNEGSSKSDNVTLTVTPLEELKWLGSSTSLQLALNWQRTRDAYGNYDDAITAELLDNDKVMYEGRVIDYIDLPANNFNRPWSARLTAITEIPQLNLTWSNFLRYRGAYDQLIATGDDVTVDGQAYQLFETARVKAAPTWDMRVDWELPTGKDQALFMAVDITNVTDKVNPIISSGSAAKTTYEVGRQYWLEVGYRF
ncbi:TonB-dependent outermembrane receptor [Pseudomonas sp. StFLB209]|uniref:TonB-dependent receptor n=1 Tax=Pseudomonas sp. StFLB209 TaxID=1028989 RepID=UPI0004F7877D|nr:TonB-dependent receptor [Pseudomonas sp. StFLB209]BAP45813.1 TonB-dependent outermembrane receptor [Pseudomonas sp. StFLB209]